MILNHVMLYPFVTLAYSGCENLDNKYGSGLFHDWYRKIPLYFADA
jgi:hypothetical protein